MLAISALAVVVFGEVVDGRLRFSWRRPPPPRLPSSHCTDTYKDGSRSSSGGSRRRPYEVLATLGRQIAASPAPADMLPSVGEGIATVLRAPYVAIEIPGLSNPVVAVGVAGTGQSVAWTSSFKASLSVRSSSSQVTRPIALLDPTSTYFKRLHRMSRLRHAPSNSPLGYKNRVSVSSWLAKTNAAGSAAISTTASAPPSPRSAWVSTAPEAICPRGGRENSSTPRAKISTKRWTTSAASSTPYARQPSISSDSSAHSARKHPVRLAAVRTVRVDSPALIRDLPAATEVAAYRIAIEAITNARRHSEAADCTCTWRSTVISISRSATTGEESTAAASDGR